MEDEVHAVVDLLVADLGVTGGVASAPVVLVSAAEVIDAGLEGGFSAGGAGGFAVLPADVEGGAVSRGDHHVLRREKDGLVEGPRGVEDLCRVLVSVAFEPHRDLGRLGRVRGGGNLGSSLGEGVRYGEGSGGHGDGGGCKRKQTGKSHGHVGYAARQKDHKHRRGLCGRYFEVSMRGAKG